MTKSAAGTLIESHPGSLRWHAPGLEDFRFAVVDSIFQLAPSHLIARGFQPAVAIGSAMGSVAREGFTYGGVQRSFTFVPTVSHVFIDHRLVHWLYIATIEYDSLELRTHHKVTND